MSAPTAGFSSATAAVSSNSPLLFSAAAATLHMHPRHIHSESNPAASSSASVDAAAAQADRPPPAARLYRHALESIFGWLNQRELVTALQASKDWLAAVRSMASLRLTVWILSAPLRVVAESAIGRHVTQLGKGYTCVPLTADSLFIIARLMPQLRGLSCRLHLTPSEGPLTFPPALQTLRLQFSGDPGAADVNAALSTISHLPLLESLAVHPPSIGSQLSFAVLISMPQLRHLTIDQPDDHPDLTDAQVNELRAMPLLPKLHVWPMSTSLLRRLLTQPHNLQWQQIALPEQLDDEVAALLPQLPSLTSLDESSVVTCSHFDFLRRLPNLAEVYLDMREPSAAGRIESLMAALQCCGRIEELYLGSTEITAAHLNELLPRLPRLRKLYFSEFTITTLAFLAQQPMTGQLTFFQLQNCAQLPLTELRHLHTLRGLKSLIVWRSFSTPMDALSQSLYTPPSTLMPQLEKFTYMQP